MNTPPVKIKRAYIQTHEGIVAEESFFKAWDGFRKRGIPCELFDPQQLHQHTLPLERDTLVVGGVPIVEAAMAMIGIPVPVADNLPACLAQYRGRKVWPSTWGELRAKLGKQGPPSPLFVKPLRRNKAFPAIALFDAEDMAAAARLADHLEVLVAEYVVFVSEWRCFVRHERILELCRYQGDVFRYPDPQVIQKAVIDFGQNAPAAYAIDFGVLTDGRTVLVEVNEGYSLGSYGLDSIEYSELLEARWVELAGRSIPS